jgi:hypothetical protein
MNVSNSGLTVIFLLAFAATRAPARAAEGDESLWFDDSNLASLIADDLSISSVRPFEDLPVQDSPPVEQALVPLPPAAWSGASVLLGMAIVAIRRRTPQSRSLRQF